MDQYNNVHLAAGTPYMTRDNWHVYGQLWVPAANGQPGYLQNYFDGMPTSKFTWNPGDPGSIIDTDHLQVILGADPPVNPGDPVPTEFVDWVHVWQK